MWCDQLVDCVGTPGAGRVRLDGRRVLQQGLRTLPQALDALGGGEERVIVAHGVHDQPLVRLEDVAGAIGFLGGELHAQLVELHAGSGSLAVERQRDLRLISKIKSQVSLAGGADTSSSADHTLPRLFERDREDPLRLRHSLAAEAVERYAS